MLTFARIRVLLSSLLLLVCPFYWQAEGQVTTAPFLSPDVQFFDNNGNPLAGGCVFTYGAGTTSQLLTYSDQDGAAVHANTDPVTLDSGGRAKIWLNVASAYKYVIKSAGGTNCASGSLIRTVDNVLPATGVTWPAGGVGYAMVYGTGGWTGQSKPFFDVRDYSSLDAANTAFGSTRTLAFLHHSLATQTPTWTTWDENTGILSAQRNAQKLYGNLQPVYSPFQMWMKKTTDLGGTDMYSPFASYLIQGSGGYSATNPATGANKPSFMNLGSYMQLQGSGQAFNLHTLCYKYGRGECFGLDSVVYANGTMPTHGDEGYTGIKGAVIHGAAGFARGTVASYLANVVTFSGASDTSTIGEARLLVNTAAAKTYTTDSIATISGTPPTVTSAGGTAWATTFGAGAHTDLCFAMDADAVTTGGLTYRGWIPVRSITNETVLVLNHQVPYNTDTAYLGSGSGAYRIAYCSQVASWVADPNDLSTAGTITQVAGGTTNWTAVDTWEVPVGYNGISSRGAMFTNGPMFPAPTNTAYGGINITGNGYVPLTQGIYLAGLMTRGIHFGNTWGCDSVQTSIAVAPAGCSSAVYQFTNAPPRFLYSFGTSPTANLELYSFPNGYMRFTSITVEAANGPYWTWGNASNANQMQLFFRGANAGLLLTGIGVSTDQQLTSTIATGTAPLVVSSTTPPVNLNAKPLVYGIDGTQLVSPHIVRGSCTLGTSCAITLTNAAVFGSNSSYDCATTDATGANAVMTNKISGSAVTFTGTGTDVVTFICVGN